MSFAHLNIIQNNINQFFLFSFFSLSFAFIHGRHEIYHGIGAFISICIHSFSRESLYHPSTGHVAPPFYSFESVTKSNQRLWYQLLGSKRRRDLHMWTTSYHIRKTWHYTLTPNLKAQVYESSSHLYGVQFFHFYSCWTSPHTCTLIWTRWMALAGSYKWYWSETTKEWS